MSSHPADSAASAWPSTLLADDALKEAVLAAVQASGEAWMSGTTWDGRRATRISVSNWSTTDEDVDRTLAAFAAAVG